MVVHLIDDDTHLCFSCVFWCLDSPIVEPQVQSQVKLVNGVVVIAADMGVFLRCLLC